MGEWAWSGFDPFHQGDPGQFVAWGVSLGRVYFGGREWVCEIGMEGSVCVDCFCVAAVRLDYFAGLRYSEDGGAMT